ncbi:MAG TPA: DUF5672 family protein [Pyrinomonadaceae bacterium]|nr:DUF5672 family protein [Pyrinomonadaceae bacterium]
MSNRAVVLVFSHKPRLEWYEEISFRQCLRVLNRHPLRLVCPEGLDVSAYRAMAPALAVDFIPPEWMSSYRAYNRLKILPFLYRRYARFEYILTYELDAFVFRDELSEWCSKGWDYVGAPWFEGWQHAARDARPIGVGNSGFSLRRTRAVLQISGSWRYQQPATDVLRAWRRGEYDTKRLIGALTYRNNFFAPFNDRANYYNEDVFWGRVVAERFPSFRVAPYEVARQFSFEVNPGRLFRECGHSLPFGCHKWMEFEPEFWYEHIRPLGYVIPARVK